MRLLVLGLNWIASPQSLIDICMPQFIMISNEKIIHWGCPIANSICEVEEGLSTLGFPWGLRGTSGKGKRHTNTVTHAEQSRYSALFPVDPPLDLVSAPVYHFTKRQLLFTCSVLLRIFTRNKSQPREPKLSKHLPGSKVRGLEKNVATWEEHNPERSICKIKALGLKRLAFICS